MKLGSNTANCLDNGKLVDNAVNNNNNNNDDEKVNVDVEDERKEDDDDKEEEEVLVVGEDEEDDEDDDEGMERRRMMDHEGEGDEATRLRREGEGWGEEESDGEGDDQGVVSSSSDGRSLPHSLNLNGESLQNLTNLSALSSLSPSGSQDLMCLTKGFQPSPERTIQGQGQNSPGKVTGKCFTCGECGKVRSY